MKKLKVKRRDQAFYRALGFGRDGKFSYEVANRFWRSEAVAAALKKAAAK